MTVLNKAGSEPVKVWSYACGRKGEDFFSSKGPKFHLKTSPDYIFRVVPSVQGAFVFKEFEGKTTNLESKGKLKSLKSSYYKNIGINN